VSEWVREWERESERVRETEWKRENERVTKEGISFVFNTYYYYYDGFAGCVGFSTNLRADFAFCGFCTEMLEIVLHSNVWVPKRTDYKIYLSGKRRFPLTSFL